MRIEMLYPEVANLHGDNHNIVYLSQCRPDTEVVRTSLTDRPAFVDSSVDMIYLGPMTESGQLKVIAQLTPFKTRLQELIDAGTVFLFTHNAMEVLGESVINLSIDQEVAGVGILPIVSRIDLMKRYTGKVIGHVEGTEVVGYKSQFSMIEADDSLPGFLTADKGIGRNRKTRVEGVRLNNFIGTSLIGPLLINNPDFTKALQVLIDPDTEPTLAYEDLATACYQARRADFSDPSRWHPWETPSR